MREEVEGAGEQNVQRERKKQRERERKRKKRENCLFACMQIAAKLRDAEASHQSQLNALRRELEMGFERESTLQGKVSASPPPSTLRFHTCLRTHASLRPQEWPELNPDLLTLCSFFAARHLPAPSEGVPVECGPDSGPGGEAEGS